MNFPQSGEYIDIHTHGGKPASDVFIVKNLMAHEGITPGDIPGQVCSFGIHPWYLNDNNIYQLLGIIKEAIGQANLIAIGEAGFDRLRGASTELQRRALEQQIAISEEIEKPLVIHCVRAWDELFAVHKKLHPRMPWLVHGFRGNIELAKQLLSKGMYLSFWFDYIIRQESASLLKRLPHDRIFLETDGAEIDIRSIYLKVACDLEIQVDELKSILLSNFRDFFNP